MEKALKFLTIDDQALMIESSRRVTLPRGTVVLQQGDESAHAIYTICSGVARVEVNGVCIAHLGPGSLIGEMSFLEDLPASASVVAHTELGVDVVDSEHLHALLASVPGFATRFYMSLAALISERLRAASHLAANSRSSLQLDWRRLTRAGAAPAAECPERVVSGLDRLCGEMRDLSGGPRAGESCKDLAAQVASICDRLHGLLTDATATYPQQAASIGELVFRQAFPYLMASRINEHAYAKPHGYDGDGELLALIRADHASGHGAFGTAVDRWVLDRPIVRRLRVRGAWIMRSLRAFIEEWQGRTPVPVTCLMTGTAGDVLDLQDCRRALDVTCLEMDPETLEDVAERCKDQRGEVRICFVQTNLLAIGRGSGQTFLHSQKAIIAPDLLNRYDDETAAVHLLDWIHEHLRTDGVVIMGQLRPDHPDRAYLEHILKWHYCYRDQDELEGLFAASKFKNDMLTIERHDDGVQTKAICCRQDRH